MSESNSFVDSSFIFVTELSQVLPPLSLRPLTVTSDAKFPSSISTLSSPIDSNSSSLGTLKVCDHATFTFHPYLEPNLQPPTSNLPITLLAALPISSAPARPTSTTGLVVQLAEYALRASISSTGMAAFVTYAVSTLRGMTRRELVMKNRSQMTSDTFHSPVDDDHTTFLAGTEAVTFVGRPFALDEASQHLVRLRRWGLTFSAFASFRSSSTPF